MKILLVNPEFPDTYWSFRHALPFEGKRCAFPPLGLLTVSALLPPAWERRLVDLNVQRLKDADLEWADMVFATAMLAQKESLREVVQRAKKMGKRVVLGGPYVTSTIEELPDADCIFRGEAERTLPQFVEDVARGEMKRIYQASERPALAETPIPDFALANLKRYSAMSVQYSRGCPFSCEFCDIIEIYGRIPRTKSNQQILAEFDALKALGWRGTLFIVDDNFIGNKQRTRALLRELIEWRRTRPGIGFFTEASMNLADDPELCALMVEAGFKKVFVGIETPSVESLEECHKLQNRNRDLVASVHTLQRAGLEVMAGFIVGFDSDKSDIFRRQFEFIQRSGVAMAMVGLLNALPQTRLWQRLKREGRLEAESTGNNTDAALNFKPKLNRDFLQSGYRELVRKLYEPRNYYQRIRTLLKSHRPTGPRLHLSWADIVACLKSFWVLGVWHRGRVGYWRLFWGTLIRHPRQFPHVIELVILGYHFRRVANSLQASPSRRPRRLG
jgi:radical SAM superfamily enzyme YgiQ (UPF0313 family)